MRCARAGISWQGQVQLVAFCVFEACVGLFWPSMMKQRAAHVPEEMRATIINFFRIPLNLFVCVVLYNVRAPPTHACMHACTPRIRAAEAACNVSGTAPHACKHAPQQG